ncbi:MAG: argininosuccinate lyase, partial [Calditrichaeota bacterium]|nr:argininosuccinate lyase [Calditrichota bacterium]
MLWGARFKQALDPGALAFSSSLAIDQRLLSEDITASIAHAAMLAEIGILNADDYQQINSGLQEIEALYQNGDWQPAADQFEDIHSAIEAKLTELIAEAAGILHSGRSRNDQVITAVMLWLRAAVSNLKEAQSVLQDSLLHLAKQHLFTVMPAYTHLQQAQPVSLAYHLLTYVEMLQRDKQRLDFVCQQIAACPLGSAAVAGSTLPL